MLYRVPKQLQISSTWKREKYMSCSMMCFEMKSQLKAWIKLVRRGREIPSHQHKKVTAFFPPNSKDAASTQFLGHMLVK